MQDRVERLLRRKKQSAASGWLPYRARLEGKRAVLFTGGVKTCPWLMPVCNNILPQLLLFQAQLCRFNVHLANEQLFLRQMEIHTFFSFF